MKNFKLLCYAAFTVAIFAACNDYAETPVATTAPDSPSTPTIGQHDTLQTTAPDQTLGMHQPTADANQAHAAAKPSAPTDSSMITTQYRTP